MKVEVIHVSKENVVGRESSWPLGEVMYIEGVRIEIQK